MTNPFPAYSWPALLTALTETSATARQSAAEAEAAATDRAVRR